MRPTVDKGILLVAVSFAALTACGSNGREPLGGEMSPVQTSVAPAPVPPSTTLPDSKLPQAPEPETYPTATLAPDGAYPIIWSDDPTDSLRPGRYRVRDAYSADWPEQCLPERLVLPKPDGTFDINEESNENLNSDDLLRQDEAGRQAMQRIQDLQTPICAKYWDEWISLWPKSPTGLPVEPGNISPTTTLDDVAR